MHHEIEIDSSSSVRFPRKMEEIEPMEVAKICSVKSSIRDSMKNVTSASDDEFSKFGLHIQCKVRTIEDLNRNISGSKIAKAYLHELYIELVPWISDNGVVTIKDLVEVAHTKISHYIQSMDKKNGVKTEHSKKFSDLLQSLERKLTGEPFTLSISDLYGTCHIQSFSNDPKDDTSLRSLPFIRTISEDDCISVQQHTSLEEFLSILQAADRTNDESLEAREMDALMDINTDGMFDIKCDTCGGNVSMKANSFFVPYFSKILVMCSACDGCAFRSTSLFSCESVKPKGVVYSLRITHKRDLQRFICKGTDGILGVKELDFHMKSIGFEAAYIGTLDDILRTISEKLRVVLEAQDNESAQNETDLKIPDALIQIANGKCFDCTLYIDDPSGRSYIQNMDAPDDDPYLTITHYKRTPEQDKELSITTPSQNQ